ncbi:MAG: glycosyltransferase [Bifidobacteriaceae bacterium]|jgi:glycosyltransferase involved in cell wall biosynthesis|nr:glycosyltransferase [Bifidobacteriaceae bacterium]
MHVAFFSDQHPATLGGLQVSVGLQRDFLEALGHTATVCAPNSRRRPSPQYARPEDVLVRAMHVGEQSFHAAGRLVDRATDAGFAKRPPVQIVHVEADTWGAWNGYRFARRHGLPLVHTMHTNIEPGLPGVVPFPRAAFRLLYAAQQHYLETGPVRDMAAYVQAFSQLAQAVIVPSAHFARRLGDLGVEREVHVVPTGVDDRLIDSIRGQERLPRARPIMVWPGRVSREKRLDETIRAFALAQVDAEIHVYGDGRDLHHCVSLCRSLGVDSRVRFRGTISHHAMLAAIRQADVVIQSSLGFETQGLTVYEAVSLGTPVLIRDPEIARDLPPAWRHTVADPSIGAFAAALRRLPELLSSGQSASCQPPLAQFRQSLLTARIVEIYQEVLAARPTRSPAHRRTPAGPARP